MEDENQSQNIWEPTNGHMAAKRGLSWSINSLDQAGPIVVSILRRAADLAVEPLAFFTENRALFYVGMTKAPRSRQAGQASRPGPGHGSAVPKISGFLYRVAASLWRYGWLLQPELL